MSCANHPDREHVAFCQHCGKPLCQECVRSLGNSIFCEPCLAVRTAAPGHTVPGAYYPPPPPGAPNPFLAGVLGLIPGVGAMYNGQYAKGIAHLIIFALLVSLANGPGIFGLFVAGWVFYQVIEAYHTAQARRDGLPLPNPFGLNDLGERLGFGRSWPSAASPINDTPPTAGPQPQASSTMPPYNYTYVPPPAVDDLDDDFVHSPNRFPSGAIWLIGLGLFFLLGNLHVFGVFPTRYLVPLFLIGIGVWLFIRRMTTSVALLPDSAADHRLRVYLALQSSIWVMLIGVLFLLNNEHILRWGRSWPLFWIVGGVMLLAKRAAYAGTLSHPEPPAPPPAPGTAIVTTTADSREEN
jgi:hypothetical protein